MISGNTNQQRIKKPTLLIISDTPMYTASGNETAVFEPTLREVEALTTIFHSISWMGFDYGNMFPANVRTTCKKEIEFIRLPKATGGDHWYNKLRILQFIPRLCWTILREAKKFDFIHTRGPSVPAAIAIIIDLLILKKKFWHKYAGNWRQRTPPASYGLQRWLLKLSKSFVAVNGRVSTDSVYIRQFVNPCFYKDELTAALAIATDKCFNGQINLLFVGRMEREKGAFTVLEALPNLATHFSLKMVGVGKDMEEIQSVAQQNKCNVAVLGAMSRDELNNLYANAHLILLPTVASEGFPKVLAEAAGYGCIPMVTAVSSIPDYIKGGQNGFILKDSNPATLVSALNSLPDYLDLKQLSIKACHTAKLFTYEQYTLRIQNEFVTKK